MGQIIIQIQMQIQIQIQTQIQIDLKKISLDGNLCLQFALALPQSLGSEDRVGLNHHQHPHQPG